MHDDVGVVAGKSLPADLINSLDPVDVVRPVSDADLVVLEKIKNLLEENGALGRFGVHLLHKHFDLKADEILMEYTDEDSRIQTISVEKRENIPSDGSYLETQWNYDRATASMGCVGFCHYDRGHRRIHNYK